MKDRIDPLIQDRAPWLFSGRPGTAATRALLNRLLSHEKTLDIAEAVKDLPSAEIMRSLAALLALRAVYQGQANIPRSGAALIVANHPTGIADGIILHDLLQRIRPDSYYFANHDILRVLPQMADMIAPVEWRKERRSHAKTRETMRFTRRAVDTGRLGVIFPSGRLAKRVGLRLHERPWMGSAAMIARKFDLPVIPVHIEARNSALFYLCDVIHPSLRDITLFHETLNKARQTFAVTVGEPISASALPDQSDAAIALLREATLALGAQHESAKALKPPRFGLTA
ncbi:lysophospholipid acyltransferase family protein [Pacificoceanicola onchidii]|uniref:lysophospholipid acyltransferase family protein n=1 Tax=Pacificoceanicola onchidii TaxID=2562685 RepID=UPI0010A4B234|nr:lysophospholipid acyltransferase family protein [Pacificoceanicola onchidii]